MTSYASMTPTGVSKTRVRSRDSRYEVLSNVIGGSENDPWKTARPEQPGVASGNGSTTGRRSTISADPAITGRGATISGAVIIVILCAVSLGLAFQSGAYDPRQWLPSLVGVAALGLVVTVAGPHVPATRFQKTLLALFAAQTLWTAASILWATSTASAWEETNRTLFYAITVALAFTAIRWSRRNGMKALVVLLACCVAVVALAVVVLLAADENASDLFVGGRLNHPIGYFNALASFLMIGFWLAVGMASAAGKARPPAVEASRWAIRIERDRLPRWTQPLLLALAVVLLEVALLPQSRGAFWTFFLTLPFFVILSPNRFRGLADLVAVALPVVLFWGKLNGPYTAFASGAPLDPALDVLLPIVGYSVLIVLGEWVLTWLIERVSGPLPAKAIKWISIALIALVLAGGAGALLYAHQETGGLGDYLGDRWEEMVGDQGTVTSGASRFTAVGLNGRLRQWKVAYAAFVEEPLLGLGAQNFEIYWYEHRTVPLGVKQPHSQPMQLLSELGFPGLALWVAFVAATLVYAVRVRFRAPGRATQAAIGAAITAVMSWLIHSSADWLWQMASVSLPALLLLGGLAAIGAETATPGGWTSGGETPTVAGSAPPSPALRGTGRRLARVLALALALAVMVSAALPYLALRYCDLAASSRSLARVATRTETAAFLDPTSALPFSVQAGGHWLAAQKAPEGSPERLAHYLSEASAWVKATEREPGRWLYYFKAAEAFLAARDAALDIDPAAAEQSAASARGYLAEASRLNPLSDQIEDLEKAF